MNKKHIIENKYELFEYCLNELKQGVYLQDILNRLKNIKKHLQGFKLKQTKEKK